MFSKGVVDENGAFLLPKEFVERWFRQIETPFSELSEPEKESDRKETRNYLPLIKQLLESQMSDLRKKIVKLSIEKVINPDVTDTLEDAYDKAIDDVFSLINPKS